GQPGQPSCSRRSMRNLRSEVPLSVFHDQGVMPTFRLWHAALRSSSKAWGCALGDLNCVTPGPSDNCSAVAVVREDQKRLRSPRSIGFSVAGLLGIDHHPHDGTGYNGRLINSAAWVALSAGHADTAAIGRVGPLARAAP